MKAITTKYSGPTNGEPEILARTNRASVRLANSDPISHTGHKADSEAEAHWEAIDRYKRGEISRDELDAARAEFDSRA